MAVNKFGFFADYKPGLSVIQMVISLPDSHKKTSICLTVSANSLSISECCCSCSDKIRNSLICHFELIGRVNIAPQTCHGVQITNASNLHLRFRLKSEIDRPDIDLDFYHNAQERLAASEKSCELLSSPVKLLNGPFWGYCSRCGAKVLDGQNFSRVLPMPSDIWLDGSESWWCHGSDSCHSHDTSAPESCSAHNTSGQLSMKSRDCLISESSLVVSEHALLRENCQFNPSRVVRCQRCLNVVGRGIGNTESTGDQLTIQKCDKDPVDRLVQLSMQALTFHQIDAILRLPNDARSEELEFALASYFLKERCQSNHFRFVVETRDEKNNIVPVIVLWILDVETMVFIGQHDLASSVDTHQLTAVPVIKILYKDCLRDSNKSTGQAWYKDASVHNVELPESICHRLLRQLINSTMSLPASLRRTDNGFYVGFLRRPV